ncbi:hypothetical protein BCR34DRAFT_446871, partial [Clohesyomyces aquaticus]
PVSTATPSSTEGSNVNPSSPTIASSAVATREALLNISHIRLVHHFSVVTALTLTPSVQAQDVCRSHLVKTSFDHPFLLHGILALAALHLSRSDPSHYEEYLIQAEQHHDASLAEFRSEVQDINGSNFQAVFCFAFILFPYSCAVPIDPKSTPDHVLETIIQTLALTRRVPPMVTQFYQKMLESELGRLVPEDTQGIRFDEKPSESILLSLQKFASITSELYPPDIVKAYEMAILALEVLFSVAKQEAEKPSISLVKIWPHQLSSRFIELLSAKQPGALIIFAHYAVLLAKCRQYWFMDGYAERLLKVADALIPEEWTAWLDWPKEQI